MKVIVWSEVICDDCERALRVFARPGLPASRRAEKALMTRLQALARRRVWRMEGVGENFWAGDLCARCWSNERIELLGSDQLGGTR